MAEHILETRIQLRYDTYAHWMNSDIILKVGEAAIASFPNRKTITTSDDIPENTPPAIGIKIGDGIHYFYELPWVQAVAADVYQWAKSSTKPLYGAYEIQGLADYIQANAPSGPGDGTVAPRIYQLVQGVEDNANKYFLQYKESTESDTWITDYSRYIDLTQYAKLLSWIGADIDNFASLGNRTEEHIQYDLSRLSNTDSQNGNQVVTAVSQTNGKISVTKRELGINNITGTVGVDRGGTGKTILQEGEVLVGNGANPIRSIEIDSVVDANTHLVYNHAVKAYVDSAVAGLSGAMHFIGEATVEPRGNADPRIPEYTFSRAQPGDVVLWEYKEYVWTGSSWRLLGDEGSYAVKGSITNADIDPEANIQQSKILNLQEDLADKVDKETGKGLSTNDYTNEDKGKLANIEDNAQRNVIEHILLNGTEAQAQVVDGVPKTVSLVVSEFDTTSQEKLEGIEEGAQVNTIESISLNGDALEIDNNKNVEITINEFTEEDEHKLDSIEEGAQVNVIETIYLNGRQVIPDNNKRVDFNISAFTQEYKDKLDSIETGAQVNVIEHIKVDGVTVSVDNNRTALITTNPHTEHENKIESIAINGTTYPPDQNKQVNITLDQAALNLNVLEGAQIPGSNGKEEVAQISKKLQLARMAVTGNVTDLLQTNDTYIILNCGSSTDVI